MTAKLFFSATASLTLATSLASALMTARIQNDGEQCQPERLNLPSESFVAPAGPRLESPGALDLGVSFTYWKSKFIPAPYSIGSYLGGNPVLAYGDKLRPGKVSELGSSYEPGFKVKAGWIFPSNRLELFAEYTWRDQPRTKSHATTSGNNANARAQESLGNPFPVTGSDEFDVSSPKFDKIIANWSQHLNVLDLMLSYDFYITRTLSLQPMVGLKAYESKLHIDMTFLTVNYGFTAGLPYAGSNQNLYNTQKAMGIGPRLGMLGFWNFNRNWAVYGKLAFSSPWTYFNVHRYETFSWVTHGIKAPVRNVGVKEHQWQYVGEYELGLNFQTWFYKERHQLTLRAAWELQFWQTNRMLEGEGTPLDLGPQAFQGLTLSAAFAF
jgi:hypothetical protein